MRKNYSLNHPEKRTSNIDNKLIIICLIIAGLAGIYVYTFTQNVNRQITDIQNLQTVEEETESTDVFVEDITDESDDDVSDEILESTAVSMADAGKAVADIQNTLIEENNKYIQTTANARAQGYTDAILMPDSYTNLISEMENHYMKTKPQNAASVVWTTEGVWEFNADYDYSMENNKSMDAVWTCYDKYDTDKKYPYAIVTATYITESGTFTNAVLSKTEWYPATPLDEDIIAAGAPEDPTVSADQCGDESVENGSNDDGSYTEEQEQVREELQKLIDANNAKENSLIIAH